MLRKAMFLAFAIVLAVSASASAQCLFGVYGDAAGTQTSITPIRDLGQSVFTIDVYYVMYVEDFVNGAAWNREVTGFAELGHHPIYDNTQQFLEDRVDDGYGYRFGIGECRMGFNGKAVFVMQETLILQDDFQGGTGMVQVLPNPLENSESTVYTECDQNATIVPCPDMGSLFIESVVPAAGQSFGAVKALFN